MSSASHSMSSAATNAKVAWMTESRMVGAKFSMKSKPGHWLKPCATSRALYHSMEPSSVRLILRTHLESTGIRKWKRSSESHGMGGAISAGGLIGCGAMDAPSSGGSSSSLDRYHGE